jgi:hypothetical protein
MARWRHNCRGATAAMTAPLFFMLHRAGASLLSTVPPGAVPIVLPARVAGRLRRGCGGVG